jgi:hypothetical protein
MRPLRHSCEDILQTDDSFFLRSRWTRQGGLP